MDAPEPYPVVIVRKAEPVKRLVKVCENGVCRLVEVVDNFVPDPTPPMAAQSFPLPMPGPGVMGTVQPFDSFARPGLFPRLRAAVANGVFFFCR